MIGYRDALKRIAGGEAPDLMLLHGDDPFLKNSLLRALKDHLRAAGDIDVVEWEAEEKNDDGEKDGASINQLFDVQAITTALPFWFIKRLVIAPSSMYSALSPYLRIMDAPDNPLVVVFMHARKGAPPKKLSGYVGGKGGWIVECLMKGGDLRQWAVDEARSLGNNLPGDSYSFLSFLCGNVPADMSQEIRKTAAYLGGESTITVASLKAVGCRSDASSIFELVDAVVEKRMPDVKEKLADLTEQGQAPYMVLFMIARHFIQLLESLLLRDEWKATSPADIAAELGIHPYPAEKLWRQACASDSRSVTAVLRSLLEVDLLMKNGRGDALLLLESALAEFRVLGGSR